MGGNVVEDGGLGHVDDVALAEGGGDGELVLLSRKSVVSSVGPPVLSGAIGLG